MLDIIATVMNVTKRNIDKLYGCLLKHIGAVDFIVRDAWCSIAFYDYNCILHDLRTSPNHFDEFCSTRLFKMYCSSNVYPGPIDDYTTLSKFAVNCGFTEVEVKIALVRDIVYQMKHYQLFSSVKFSTKPMQYQVLKNYEELAIAFDLA